MLAILGVTVFLGAQISNLKIDMDPDLWAPQSHPYVKATKLLESVFGGRNFTMIGIAPKEGDIYQPAILAKIQRIQAGIEAIPEAIRHNINSLAARQAKEIIGTADGMQVRGLLDTLPQSPEDIARLKAVGGGGQLPFLLIGRNKQNGFEAVGWQAAISAAGYPQENRLPKIYRNGAKAPAAPPVKSRTDDTDNDNSDPNASKGASLPAASSAPPARR